MSDWLRLVLGWFCLVLASATPAQPLPSGAPVLRQKVYVLGDSIAEGLKTDGFAAKLDQRFRSDMRINFDGARSISTRGNQIKRSGLEAIDDDQDFIAQAHVVVIVLGMNQMESSFSDAQSQLITRFKRLAPSARYFWVDIGATIAPQAEGWSERNRLIYSNASVLGYQVVSRYKAIFGEAADPFQIVAGKNFDDWVSEPGYGGPGNVHGLDHRLSERLIEAIAPSAQRRCTHPGAMTTYVLGDSIAHGLLRAKFPEKLRAQMGGDVFINADGGRSITQPGQMLRKSAMESVIDDRRQIFASHVVVIILGTNQTEVSFAESQRELMKALRGIAPLARYFWVDIGATVADQASGWSQRNRLIYDNAADLGYSVVSRYKAIFGPAADPLNITPGLNFPGWANELGPEKPGNIHGRADELAKALLAALPKPMLVTDALCN